MALKIQPPGMGPQVFVPQDSIYQGNPFWGYPMFYPLGLPISAEGGGPTKKPPAARVASLFRQEVEASLGREEVLLAAEEQPGARGFPLLWFPSEPTSQHDAPNYCLWAPSVSFMLRHGAQTPYPLEPHPATYQTLYTSPTATWNLLSLFCGSDLHFTVVGKFLGFCLFLALFSRGLQETVSFLLPSRGF